MENAIFIVTHQRGFEADPVIDKLRERSIDVFRFNTDAGDNRSLATFSSESGSIKFVCDGRSISSRDISAGWCQQLPPYQGQSADEKDSLQRTNLLALQLVSFDFLEIPWLNNPTQVIKASNKVRQIRAAKNVGLSVPKTLISNDPEIIRSFASDQVTVAKNLATAWILSDTEETQAAYTKIIDQEWLSSDAALTFAPVIYQEFHERKKDYRVVMVKDDNFAASCKSRSDQREDIRRGQTTGESYVPCDFDEKSLRKLRLLMDHFGLDYCAADFIEDKNGNIYFLELNTCGAWWWLDKTYNGAICNKIVETLIT